MKNLKKAAAVTMAAGSIVAVGAGAAAAHGGAGAHGAAVGSPGVLSGNVVQVPIHIPVNLCGNTVDIIGLLNPTFGNFCLNAAGDHHGGTKAH
ncbi:chaplin [Streptomyces aidingensis]|uniref:Small secreted domain n=1 Tax=Streptomyces aidingensis TaxID=910347 RepID=A0A1I1M8C1_9ACTN|nr:chaplin [Streptomyces aidingensis]SFC77910.1 Small secreted domain [Streptomyces aidingensis]